MGAVSTGEKRVGKETCTKTVKLDAVLTGVKCRTKGCPRWQEEMRGNLMDAPRR